MHTVRSVLHSMIHTWMYHTYGTLQLSHAGHGCTNLCVVNGKEKGNIWFDGRADYSGIFPETIGSKQRITFSEWYMEWVNEMLYKIDEPFLMR